MLSGDILDTSDSNDDQKFSLSLRGKIISLSGVNLFILKLFEKVLVVCNEHRIFVELCIIWWIFLVVWWVRLYFSFCFWVKVCFWFCSWQPLYLFYVFSWCPIKHIAFLIIKRNLYSGSKLRASSWFCSVIFLSNRDYDLNLLLLFTKNL